MTRTAQLLAAALSALAAFDQAGPSVAQESAVFRAETKLVLVRFQMTPKKGQSADLRPEDIELTEDGTGQRVALLQGGPQNPLTSPVEINLLFGAVPAVWADPGSEGLDLKALNEHPNASLAIWGIGDKLIRLTPPTRDARILNQAIAKAWQALGRAPVNARPSVAAYVAALARAAAQGRTNVLRTLVVAARNCGGREDESRVEDAMEAVRQAGIAVFPLALYTGASPLTASQANPDGRAPFDITAGAAKGIVGAQGPSSPTDSACYGLGSGAASPDDFLNRIAKVTGGKVLSRNETLGERSFSEFVGWVGDQVLRDYVAGFYPASNGEQRAHKIQVKLKDPKRGQITGYAQTVVH